MQEGDARPAPAPKIAEPAAITERAIDKADRRATVLPVTEGELRSTLAFIFPPHRAMEGCVDLEVNGER
jgi:hypothetical protein